VENGGFETGDFTGWDIHCNVEVQSDVVYEGNYAAGLSISDINHWWHFEWDTNPYNAFLAQLLEYDNNYSYLKLRFAYNVDVLRDWGLDEDDLYVGFLGVSNLDNCPSDVSIYFYYSLVTSGDTGGWQVFEDIVDLSQYSIDCLALGFFFADKPSVWKKLGSIDASSAFIDSVSVDPVPEPATMILVGCGILGLVGFRMKKS